MTKTLFRLTLTLFLFGIFAQSCQKDEPSNTTSTLSTDKFDHEVATKWFDLLRELTKKTPGYTPPVAARSFGYAGVALWESVVPGIVNGKSLEGQLTQLENLPKIEPGQSYYWPACANAALATIAQNFYPTAPSDQLLAISDLEDVMVARFSADADEQTLERSAVFGKKIGEAIFEWSKTDGGHEGYSKNFPSTYTPPVGAGFWVPTKPAFLRALQPYWGNNRSFVPNCVPNSQPVAHPDYSISRTSVFYSQALEVYSVTKNLTLGQKKIAQFWSDDPGVPGTPPGHSVNIASIVIQKEGLTLDKAAETFCKVSVGLADAFISCWKCKYDYSLMRPVTYINQQIDANWSSLLTTPPFPEYTSGHSVQSGATAEVLSDLFGYSYRFTDNTHKDRTDIDGSPRTFNSFYEAAQEAGVSRLYGGIHYRQAIDLGITQGTAIGKMVNGLRFRN